MKKLMLFVILALSSLNAFAVEKGEKAPDFKVYTTRMQPFGLDQLMNNKTVLAFVPGAFTGVCTKEICSFRDDLKAFEELDADIAVVTTDSPFANAAWATEHEVTFPILADVSKETVKAFDVFYENFAGIQGFTVPKRAIFIIDEQGMVEYKWVAENPGLEPPYDEIKKALSEMN
ncbi:MAG: redoxin domain-containing protein [Candidatus Kapaibacterium sp.]